MFILDYLSKLPYSVQVIIVVAVIVHLTALVVLIAMARGSGAKGKAPCSGLLKEGKDAKKGQE